MKFVVFKEGKYLTYEIVNFSSKLRKKIHLPWQFSATILVSFDFEFVHRSSTQLFALDIRLTEYKELVTFCYE